MYKTNESLDMLNNNIESESPVLSKVLPWIQWLHIYAFIPGVTLGYVVIVVLDVIYLIAWLGDNRKVTIDKSSNTTLFLFFVVVLLTLPISLLISDSVLPVNILNRILKLITLYLLITVSCSRINYNDYMKSLRLLTYIAAAILFIQFFQKTFLGSYSSFKLPFLEYASDSTEAKLSGINTGSRFRSIFTEPSHYIYFVFQYQVALLFGGKVHLKEILIAAGLSVSVILSGSSTGLIFLAIVWTVYAFDLVRKEGLSTNKIVLIAFLVILLYAAIVWIMNNETLYNAVYRLTGDYERSNVVWKRIYACWDDYLNMTTIQKIFGLGMGNIPKEFMNSFIYLLRSVGIVGTCIIIVWMTKLFCESNKCGRVAVVLLVLLSAIDMVLFTPTVLGYMIIINHNKKCDGEYSIV